MKTALKDIEKARNDLEKRKAALKMERALAEVSEAAGALNASFDVSTDFGRIMGKLDDQINRARARSKVASDLSGEGVEKIKARQEADKAMARELLEQFKVDEGLVSASSAQPAEKTVGPATTQAQGEKTLGPEQQAKPQSEQS